MRICIPTADDTGLDASLFDHFGSAPYFTVVDLDAPRDGRVRAIRNPACHDHHGVCQHVPILEAQAVDAVVCRGIGRRAARGLRAAGIEVLVPDAPTVRAIVEAAPDRAWRPLADDEACGGGRRHGHGHGRGHGRGHRRGPRSRTPGTCC